MLKNIYLHFKSMIILMAILVSVISVDNLIFSSEDDKTPYQIGSTVEAFVLKDVAGNEHNISEVLGEKIIVIDFWNMNCPFSRAYEERLKTLRAAYDENEIAIYAVDSNHINEIKVILDYTKKYEMNIPVLKDWDNIIADRFGAELTPQVFIIGKDKQVKYNGPFDDNQNARRVTKKFVEEALNALLAGKEVAESVIKPFGCTIKRKN